MHFEAALSLASWHGDLLLSIFSFIQPIDVVRVRRVRSRFYISGIRFSTNVLSRPIRLYKLQQATNRLD